MFCVGLTGSIASGKSTVASFFAKLGIDVIYADLIAKKMTQQEYPAFQKIVDHFGQEILTHSGELNRRKLRSIIFNNAAERQWLETLLHPLIRQQILIELNKCTSPYCIIEIPLLADKTAYPYLKRVLLVKAEPAQQITRLVIRDGCTREEALIMLANHETRKNTFADDIIMNFGDMEQLEQEVFALHQQYLLLSASLD